MKKHYPWLWFDADGTLFDFQRAEVNALVNAFDIHRLPFESRYMEIYQKINQGLWGALERHEITPEALKVKRFELLLEQIDADASPQDLSHSFIDQLSRGTDLLDGARDVLQTLARTSRIAVITNGLQAVQRSRLKRSDIRDFISELIISEEIGAAKPHAGFFDAAFARTGNPPKGDVLVIGDSLSSDIRGGVDYGLDTCWFNPAREPHPDGLQIKYDIRDLHELLNLLN